MDRAAKKKDKMNLNFMCVFQRMKFKMKMSYACYKKKLPLAGHILETISRTVDEKIVLARK